MPARARSDAKSMRSRAIFNRCSPCISIGVNGRTHYAFAHSMKDETFRKFVMDQLGGLPELRVKAMFGGHGLYQGKQFFGILMEGRLYFKTDEATRAAYLERGMGPFIYENARRTMTMHYFEVPADVLENREELVRWAREAIGVAEEERR